ncbi:hypothetical protein GGTG_07328 [Gaeumannomyces tritici R3-111a-1]|uniref:Uncharacterized protein n=1 Tax=Gaeumannomyces tritici (strain R3-111a-1) TaxID=644352 RepID=J3P1D1_GAET3|nr:hypothetical protein GGTG_07328 [Gaeumannomyces tritici R3-111a-1]EJT77416.1 hypothetical protein GGTG_07328 [Gaeumannomyces tritici R3-111a-1]
MQLKASTCWPLLAAVIFSLTFCRTAEAAPIPSAPEVAPWCQPGEKLFSCEARTKRSTAVEPVIVSEQAAAAPSRLSARDPQCQDLGFGCVTQCDDGFNCRSVARPGPAKRHVIEEHADSEKPVPEGASARMITRSS